MYDEYIVGKRFYKPFIVSEKDTEILRRRLKKESKVKTVVIIVQNDGYLTQQQIADLAGITRMTLFRWRTTDRAFQREYDRLSDKAMKHWRKESRKGKRRPSVADILSDENLYRVILGL